MNNEMDVKQRSRNHLEKWLVARGMDQTTPHGFFQFLNQHASDERWQFDWQAALEHWWELSRCGAVALLGSSGSFGSYAQMPGFVVTARGRAMLAGRSVGPHDETKFMNTLRSRVANPDAIAVSYLSEAIHAWQAGLNRSSAVMLGCACERIVLVVAECVAAARLEPASEKLSKLLGGRRAAQISEVYSLVHEGLKLAADRRVLSAELSKSVIERRLTPIFEHTRILRNSSGHPTAETVTSEEAEAGLLLFANFHVFANEICNALVASSA